VELLPGKFITLSNILNNKLKISNFSIYLTHFQTKIDNTSQRNGARLKQKPSANVASAFHKIIKQAAPGLFGSPGYQSELFTGSP
jgi:hypothetical protein